MVSDEMKCDGSDKSVGCLTKKDYFINALMSSYFVQNGQNYNNYQGSGYAMALYPALKKIYGSDKDRLCDELAKNVEFFNSNPNLIPFIQGVHITMADKGFDYSDIRGIKMALMGPLAGIGDSLSQFCLAPLMSTLFASLALQGVPFAPIGFALAMNGTLLALRMVMSGLGRKMGTAIVDKFSSTIAKFSEAANIVGVTVVMGLAATYVKMSLAVQFAAGELTEGVKQQFVNLQSLLDGIAPALLPILFTLLMLYLIKKKHMSAYTLVIITIVFGVACSVLGILA